MQLPAHPSFQSVLRLLCFGLCAGLSAANAADWPQILGPQRNGASSEKIPDKLPADGKAAWSMPLGQGYAGPAVAGNRVIAFHRPHQEDVERIEAFDLASGRSLWKSDVPARYRGGIDPDLGPRSVPLVHRDRVIVYGAAGECRCVNLTDGKTTWSRTLAEDYGAPDGYFGAGTTPLAIEDRVLVNVGGKKAGIVGLDLATGKTVWAATTEAASYSSPCAITRGDVVFALFITRLHIVLVDPRSGEAETWFDFGRSGPTVNAAVPLVIGDRLFCTSSYGVGALCADLSVKQPREIWSNDESLSSQYSTPVHREGYLYGNHGREDIPPAHYRCVELATGKVMWSRDDFGVAHSILVGDKLLLLKIDGELVLAEANPKAYRELGRVRVSKGITRALPAFSGGRLVFRDDAELKCVELTK